MHLQRIFQKVNGMNQMTQENKCNTFNIFENYLYKYIFLKFILFFFHIMYKYIFMYMIK